MVTGAQKFRAEGRAEGRAEALVEQMRHKFGEVPDGMHGRLAQASEEELAAWGRHLLDAKTLDAVFSAEAR